MPKYPLRVFVLALFLLGVSLTAVGQTPLKPMHASELLALVAGSALPENVVHEITRRGLNFRPDQKYKGQLKEAGAANTVLTAILAARVVAAGADRQPDKELLKHLTAAAVLMRSEQNDDAVAELSAALNSSFAGPETGFVMGELLHRQGQDRE